MGERRHRRAFRDSCRARDYCNWCGGVIETLLVHHADGNPDNNDPGNLMALCGRRCHIDVHEVMLGSGWHAKGGKAAAGAGLKKQWSDHPELMRERARAAAKRIPTEVHSRGGSTTSAILRCCPHCDEKCANPGAIAMHLRRHPEHARCHGTIWEDNPLWAVLNKGGES